MNVVLPGTIAGINTLKDGTVKTTFELQEVSPDVIGKLYSLNNQYVKVYITTENITNDVVEAVDEIELESEGKSPSKRMRNVFFRLWEQDKEGYQDFELFYRFKMNKIIEQLKGRLV